jgi:hypothetical protein
MPVLENPTKMDPAVEQSLSTRTDPRQATQITIHYSLFTIHYCISHRSGSLVSGYISDSSVLWSFILESGDTLIFPLILTSSKMWEIAKANSEGRAFFIITCVLAAVAVGFFALRMYSRYLSKARLDASDYCCLFAVVSFQAVGVGPGSVADTVADLGCRLGGGHIWRCVAALLPL